MAIVAEVDIKLWPFSDIEPHQSESPAIKPMKRNKVAQIYAQLKFFVREDDGESLEHFLATVPRDAPTTSQLISHFNQALVVACLFGKVHTALVLLQDGRAEPTFRESDCLRRAAKCGYYEICAALVVDGRADATARNSEAFYRACRHGHYEIVQLLLTKTSADPTALESLALRRAVAKKYYDVVLLLLSDGRADPTARESFVVMMSAAQGSADMLQLLLKDGRADPSARNDIATLKAARWGQFKTVILLLQDSRVDPIVNNHEVLKHLVDLAGRYRGEPPVRRISDYSEDINGVAYGRGQSGLAEGLAAIRMFLQHPRTAITPVRYQQILSQSDRVPSIRNGSWYRARDCESKILTDMPVPVEVKSILDELQNGTLPKQSRVPQP